MALINLNSSYSSKLTLVGGNTYYMATNIDMQNNILEFDMSGDIYLKRNNDVSFTSVTNVETINDNSTYKVHYTVKDHNLGPEDIPGSTGSPSITNGQIVNTETNNVNINYWEIYYLKINNNSGIIKQNVGDSSSYTASYKNIHYINCESNSNSQFIRTDYYSSTIQYITCLSVDGNVNIENVILCNFDDLVSININDIKIESDTTSPSVSIKFINDENEVSFSNIYIKNNIGEDGIRFQGNIHFENCYFDCQTQIDDNNFTQLIRFQNCLFDGSNNAVYPPFYNTAIECDNNSEIVNIQLEYCIFTNYEKCIKRKQSGQVNLTLCKNNIFINNSVVFETLFSSSNVDYNGWWNNDTIGVTQGANKIEANPNFITIPGDGVINSDFYIPDGYFVSNGNYFSQGSDTFDNLGIDEQQYSATGYQYQGTQNITPGINYQVSTFSDIGLLLDITAPIATFELETIISSMEISLDITAPIATFESETITDNKIDLDITAPIAQFSSETLTDNKIDLDITAPIAQFELISITDNKIDLDITAPIATFESETDEYKQLDLFITAPIAQCSFETNIPDREPIITIIERQLATQIEAMSQLNLFLLNWGPVNYTDRALEDSTQYEAYATIEFIEEKNLDKGEKPFGDRYSNQINYILQVRVPMTTESSNPKYDGQDRAQIAVSDIKLMLARYPELNGAHVQKIMYMGSRKSNIENVIKRGDRFTPLYLDINIAIFYDQSRTDVFQTIS